MVIISYLVVNLKGVYKITNSIGLFYYTIKPCTKQGHQIVFSFLI